MNIEWQENLVSGLVGLALAQRAVGAIDEPAAGHATDAKLGESAIARLRAALSIAITAGAKSPQSAHWPGVIAEVEVELAVTLRRHDRASTEAKTLLDDAIGRLEPLERSARIPSARRATLAQARALATH